MTALSDETVKLAERLRVKPLEWTKHPERDAWRVDTILGTYKVFAIVSPVSWTFDGHSLIDPIDQFAATPEAAKADAQAHYEACILSAIDADALGRITPPDAGVRLVRGVTVRDGDDDWHLECRFADGQKFAAVTVAKDGPGAEGIAHNIAAMLLKGRDALGRITPPDAGVRLDAASMRETAWRLREHADGDPASVEQAIRWEKKAALVDAGAGLERYDKASNGMILPASQGKYVRYEDAAAALATIPAKPATAT